MPNLVFSGCKFHTFIDITDDNEWMKHSFVARHLLYRIFFCSLENERIRFLKINYEKFNDFRQKASCFYDKTLWQQSPESVPQPISWRKDAKQLFRWNFGLPSAAPSFIRTWDLAKRKYVMDNRNGLLHITNSPTKDKHISW